jgi:peptide/nickel transport system substrate-binding protein
MENRFGIKDFFLFLVLGVLIVLIVLAMFQYDRQWQVIQQNNDQLHNLTGDVARIRQQLAQGVVSVASGPVQINPLWTGLERVAKSYSSPDYAEGGDLVLVSVAQPDKLTPLIGQDITWQIITAEVMDSLITRDPNTFQFIPSLASSWTLSDDQLTIDFTLKRGITFSDGSPLTADDVVYTFDLAKNPQLEAPGMQSLLDQIHSVEKIDDYHVRFHFSAPYFKSLETAGTMLIMSKAFYSKYTVDQINNSTGLLIGSSAYRLPDPTSWTPEPGKPLVLLRNERYWGPRPSFDRIIYRVIENPAARATAFANGDINAFCGQDSGPTPEQFVHMLADPELVKKTIHFAIDDPQEGIAFVAWNQKKGRDGPPSMFADRRVRLALTMLIDRDRIIHDVLYGYGTVAIGPFHHLLDQSDPNLKPPPFDPDAAGKLLDEAGYIRRGDRRYLPDGSPFVFSLLYPNTSESRRRCANLIHDSYAKAGIQVNIQGLEWPVFEKRMNDRDYQAMLAAWGSVIDDDLYQIFDSVFIPGIGDDFIQYKNPELDATIEKARITRDHDQRTVLWRKCDDIIYQDQPYSFMYTTMEMDWIYSFIHGIEPTRIGENSYQEWYIPKNFQHSSQ